MTSWRIRPGVLSIALWGLFALPAFAQGSGGGGAGGPGPAVAVGVAAAATGGATTVGGFPADWFFGKPEQRALQDALLGKPMPELSLSDWYGEPLKTSDLKGKILVIDFWATWCGPCLRSIPHNSELAEKYKSKGVVFLGVCSSKGQEKMAEVAQRLKVNYPQAKDPEYKTETAFRVQWFPTYALVDRKGNVRAVGLWPPEHLEPALARLLAE